MSSGNLRRVLVAVDGSEQSMDALKWAIDNIKLSPPTPDSADSGDDGSITVIYVQPPASIAAGINPGSIPFGGPSMEVPAFSAAIEAHQRRIKEAILNRALEICSEKSVNVKTEVVVGDPKDKICETVDKLHADLLVMGSRGFGSFKRFFLGSVSNYCSNHASCPVVIVKGGESGQVVAAESA